MRRLSVLAGATAVLAVSAILTAPTRAAAAAGEITVLAEDIPAGLDYDGPSAAIPTSQTGMVNLMEPLVYYKTKPANSEGIGLLNFGFADANFEGRLAESWTYDAKTFTWTFKLRKGVKGCGGATFNADDVVYTFARAKSVSGAAPIGWFLSNVASIANFTPDVLGADKAKAAEAQKLGDEVKKIDDFTVAIKQSAPNKLFLPVLTIFGLGIFDKESMEKNKTATDPWSHDYANNTNVPSFGPYCLDKWTKNSEFVVKGNTDYYRGAPKVTRVVYRKVPQSSNRLAAVQRGEAALVERLTPKEFDSLRKAKGVKVAGVIGNENLFVHMNFKTPPFDNVKVRQAVAYALDYKKIIANGYFGQATKSKGPIPSSYPGYAVSKNQYDTNIEKAKTLLKEAGYKDKGAILLSYVSEKQSILLPIATQIKADLAKVGIKVKLDPLPQTQYGDRQLVKKDLQFALNDQEKPIGVDAGYATLLFFVSSDKGGLNNMINYSNTKVDDLFAKVKNEADDKTRNAELAEIQDQLMADLAWLPVVELKTQWAFNDKLSGLAWHPDSSIRWNDLKFAG